MRDAVLHPQTGEIPNVPTTAITEPFWAGCLAGELRFQRCDLCGKANFIPTDICRFCQSFQLTWVPSSGEGVLYTWSVVWKSPTPAFRVPYAPAIVELSEGYNMITNMVDCSVSDLCAGLAVTVVFHRVHDRLVLPYFRPSRGAA